ncbi:hypothetical protein [Haloechinothrix salitolerans]|uniref:Excreted virulence factor EspC, type VII ESX diderm n=1 Tax=Haloechinothrix salitolerans TaxID=926830 RepID=A0ABW2BWX4_9PSEU
MSTHDPIARILDHAEDLSVAHAHWSARDLDTPDGGGARRAATTAVESIDAMLRELHQVRSQIITEARRYDDAVGERVDALLAKRRQS